MPAVFSICFFLQASTFDSKVFIQITSFLSNTTKVFSTGDDMEFDADFSCLQACGLYTEEDDKTAAERSQCQTTGAKGKHLEHSAVMSTSLLANGIQTHPGTKVYECEFCHSLFDALTTLNTHKRIHSDKRPIFECEVCHKLVHTFSKFNQHQMCHFAERHYKCDHCQKSFLQEYNLKTHLKTHTLERPFECEICHKSFRHRKSLNCHYKSHFNPFPSGDQNYTL